MLLRILRRLALADLCGAAIVGEPVGIDVAIFRGTIVGLEGGVVVAATERAVT